MKLSLIVAMAENRTIGRDNTLPWHLSEDLKYFRRTTTGHCIIMGRNTWESIGRPLPNRRSIVVSSNPNYIAEGAEVVSSLAAAKALAESISAELGVDEAFVIGGARLYADALQQAECFHLTRVQASVEGDTHLPEFDEGRMARGRARGVCRGRSRRGRESLRLQYLQTSQASYLRKN